MMVNTYRMPDEGPQDARMDGLPLGTRGGLAIRSDFPVDGEYVIKVALTGEGVERQRLEVSVDSERVQLNSIAVGPPREDTEKEPDNDADNGRPAIRYGRGGREVVRKPLDAAGSGQITSKHSHPRPRHADCRQRLHSQLILSRPSVSSIETPQGSMIVAVAMLFMAGSFFL